MKLSLLLQAICKTLQTKDVEINLITDDSRQCTKNSVFVCHLAAKEHAEAALRRGAAVVIAETDLCENCVVVENTRQAYAALCRRFFGEADRELKLVAVTGTNGKTSVATMLAHILQMNGIECGLLSTVTNQTADGENARTTPNSFLLHRHLREMADAKKQVCVLEASSQGLEEERLYGLRFEIGIFTNLSREHLDVHPSFEAYKEAKQKLFCSCNNAVLNFDDPASADMAKVCGGKILTYSVSKNEADFTAKDIRVSQTGLDYALVSNSLIHRVRLALHGDFNVENSMAAIISAMLLGVSPEDCAAAMRTFSSVPGRMELLDTETPYRVMIDYAHTPESLRRVLLSLRRVCRGKLILVFGCGGNRDSGKRPEMGKIAASFADVVIVTSDNPREEDDLAIINQILAGTEQSQTPVFIQPDRKEAIAFALEKAKKDDLVLLAGKGHETVQIIKNESRPFNEREIVRKLLAKIKS